MDALQEHASLETRDGSAVLFEGMRAEGDLKGLLLDMSVEQRFRNPTDKNIEVVYTFPLPWGAVLLGVDVILGGKKLTGSVIEKKLAEAEYEETLSVGDAAIMLERNRDHSYSLNLGNLAAKEPCVVTLRYAQVLQFEQRGLRLLIPTVIAPRYGDPILDGGLMPHQVSGHDLLAEHPFDITLRLHGDLAKARVSSPSHPIGMASAAGMLTVTLGRQAMLDRDFVLVLDQLSQDSAVVLAKDCVDTERFVALTSFCPRVSNDATTALALKILVDCSGSMAGDSIAAARRALQSIVQQFGNEDRFSLSRFGNNVEHRSRGFWRATEKTRLSAQRWVGDLDANMGGTEMGKALGSTFRLGDSTGGDVLLITDGEIEAIDLTIKMAKASNHRLFIVGIGSSPAEEHLRRLAETTGGACDFVAPGEAVAPAVLRMFSRLRSPKLTEVRILWPGGVDPVWASPVPASVFDSDTLNVFALFEKKPVGAIQLTGKRLPDAELEVIGSASMDGEIETDDTLARMTASVRLHSMKPGAATKLAVDYQLVTDRTNFLLTHERAEDEKATEMPELHKVAPMVPAGWGGTGSVMSLINMDSIPRPAMWRRESAPDTVRSLEQNRMEAYDIPAFLRRSVDDYPSSQSKHWINVDNYEGLTPFGLCEVLRKKTELSWPTTYYELKQIGLGGSMIDWLKQVTAGSIRESAVVRTFIYLISNDDTYEALIKQLGGMYGFMALSHKVLAAFSRDRGIPIGVDLDLLDQMRQSLRDLTANAWPEDLSLPDYGDDIEESSADAMII